MTEYLTVAEIYQMQHRLIDLFGGMHGVRDKGAVEAAVFRPQTGYYNSLEEEAAALMESLANNHGFLDGNKRIAFAAADVDESARLLAGILRDEGADVLVAYDEHGGYGHPDHVMVHRVGLRAADLAGTHRVFMATVDRTYLQGVMPSVQRTGVEVTPEMTAMFETICVPGTRVTTEIDVRDYLDIKRSAMRAHASQIGDTAFFLAMSDDVFTAVWGNEWYVRVKPETGPDGTAGEREPSLLT